MSAIRMNRRLRFDIIEKSVVRDKNFLYTIISYSAIIAIFVNLNSFHSSLIGLVASVIYSMINAVFLGNAFFEKEGTFFRLMFGFLLLTMLLGFVGWLALIIYNLDITKVSLALLVVATFSSQFNRRMKHKNATK